MTVRSCNAIADRVTRLIHETNMCHVYIKLLESKPRKVLLGLSDVPTFRRLLVILSAVLGTSVGSPRGKYLFTTVVRCLKSHASMNLYRSLKIILGNSDQENTNSL